MTEFRWITMDPTSSRSRACRAIMGVKKTVKGGPDLPRKTRDGARRFRWARPELVAVVDYTERTSDGILRQPSYQGLGTNTLARR